MSGDLDLATVFVIREVGGDAMATSVLKSYRTTIFRGPDPSHPPGPLKTTNTIFQVPAGKTWLVIKLLWRAVELTKPLSTLEIHKTRGDGSDPIMLHSDTAGHVLQTPSEGLLSLSHLHNVVVDNEEMLRQVVEGPNDVVFVVTYDMSVLEMTAV